MAGVASIGGAVVFAWVLGALVSGGADVLAIGLAGILSVVIGLLAVSRFDLFVIVLLVARSSLDAFGRGGLQGGAIDPTAALGAVFVAAAGLWLIMRRQTPLWVKPSAATYALLALGAAGFASVVGSPFKVGTIEGASRLLAGVLMFAVLEQLLAHDESPTRYLWALYGSAVVPVAVGYLQVVRGTGATSIIEAGRAYGTFAHPNLLASYLVNLILVSLMIALRESGALRRAAIAAIGAGAPLLMFTYTRSAWLALVVALAYLGWRADRRIFIGLFFGLVAVVFASPGTIERINDIIFPEETFYDGPSNSLEWRIDYWGEVLPLANESPLTGIGLEATQRVTDARLPPHNTLIQTYVETGFLGCAALVAVIVAFAVHLRARRVAAETSMQHTVALASVAIGIATVLQAPSDNLLTRTSGYWYAALAMAYGFNGARTRFLRPTPASASPSPEVGSPPRT